MIIEPLPFLHYFHSVGAFTGVLIVVGQMHANHGMAVAMVVARDDASCS
jgi:hypothetical protein